MNDRSYQLIFSPQKKLKVTDDNNKEKRKKLSSGELILKKKLEKAKKLKKAALNQDSSSRLNSPVKIKPTENGTNEENGAETGAFLASLDSTFESVLSQMGPTPPRPATVQAPPIHPTNESLEAASETSKPCLEKAPQLPDDMSGAMLQYITKIKTVSNRHSRTVR